MIKIDFKGYKYKLKQCGISVFGNEYNHNDTYFGGVVLQADFTLHTNPDYKADKSDGEFLAKTNESKEMIYTQEMFDNGEVPHVGMMFICKEKTAGSRISEFLGKAVKVVGVSNLDGDEVITFHHSTEGIGCGVFGEEWVKPIDTRTDKEKAVDAMFKVIEKAEYKKELGGYATEFVQAIIDGEIDFISFTGDKK